jgi:CRISPR/Cas system-associated exonuclease Cas4 (RecB family)
VKTFSHVSASQIDTYLTCRRKWHLNKICCLPIPQHPSAALGEEVHKGQEKFLADDEEGGGNEADVHRLAKASIPLLRQLRGNVFVEKKMERSLRNGITFVGRIDILDFKSDEDRPRILDWKTTSNMQYAKTEEELATNVQMLSYAYEALCTQPVVKAVRLAHYVIPTKNGTPRYTETQVTPLQVHKGWTQMQDIVDEMRETARVTSPDDVTPTLSACGAYGGCAFRDKCAAMKGVARDLYDLPINTSKEDTSMPTDLDYATMSALFGSDEAIAKAIGKTVDEVLAIKNGTASSAQAKPAQPAPAKHNILPPEAPVNLRDAKNTPAPTAQAQPTASQAPAASAEDKVRLLLQNGWSDDQINSMPDEVLDLVAEKNWKPTDVDFDEVPGEGPNGTDIVNVRKKPAPKPAGRQRTATAPAVTVVAQTDVVVEEIPLTPETTPEPVVEEAPRRRGRPPGAKNKATLEAEAKAAAEAGAGATTPVTVPAGSTLAEEVANITETPGPNTVRLLSSQQAEVDALRTELDERERQIAGLNQQAARLALSPPRNTDTFTLLIDAPFEKGSPSDYRLLDDVIAPFCKLAAENYKDDKGQAAPLPHILVAPFGKGPGIVAAYVLKYIGDVAKGTLYVDSRSPCAAACLEVLRPVADVVVRGTR